MTDKIAIICATIAVLGLIGASLYGCQQSRDTYYAAVNNCIARGGTWVPTGQSTDNQGACIASRPEPSHD